MIRVKTREQIGELDKAGALVAECHAIVRDMIKPGITTAEMNEAVERHIEKSGAFPGWKGIPGPSGAPPFPSVCCMSPDEQVVHGFPSDVPLRSGQVLSVDIGVKTKAGWYGDSARTLLVGEGHSPEVVKLLDVTIEALERAIQKCVPGNHLGDIGHAVQSYCESHGFGVVRDLVGHGIGQELWESPQVPNYGKAGRGLVLREGMVFCIEPMINLGTHEVDVLEDGWTIVTADRKPSVHVEHMVAVTADGPQVLSRDPQ